MPVAAYTEAPRPSKVTCVLWQIALPFYETLLDSMDGHAGRDGPARYNMTMGNRMSNTEGANR